MRVLLIDNYDSFTYNIVELLRQLEVNEIVLVKNDEITFDDARAYDKIIISPGPALPAESGNILAIIEGLSPTHAILGICLGHQAIAEVFGAKLINLPMPFHGHRTEVEIVNDHAIFQHMPRKFYAGLYHSWVVSSKDLDDSLEISSWSAEKHVMSIRHKKYNVHGVQFHPESYMTEFGKELLENFLGLDV